MTMTAGTFVDLLCVSFMDHRCRVLGHLCWIMSVFLFACQASLLNNPQQMQQVAADMMDNPIMQAVLNNPEVMRNMLESNPQVRAVNLAWVAVAVRAKCAVPIFFHALKGDEYVVDGALLCCQLLDRNPELSQALNNPALLRESMQIMSNPVGYEWVIICFDILRLGNVPADLFWNNK